MSFKVNRSKLKYLTLSASACFIIILEMPFHKNQVSITVLRKLYILLKMAQKILLKIKKVNPEVIYAISHDETNLIFSCQACQLDIWLFISRNTFVRSHFWESSLKYYDLIISLKIRYLPIKLNCFFNLTSRWFETFKIWLMIFYWYFPRVFFF